MPHFFISYIAIYLCWFDRWLKINGIYLMIMWMYFGYNIVEIKYICELRQVNCMVSRDWIKKMNGNEGWDIKIIK
jgi:hypothetical protein